MTPPRVVLDTNVLLQILGARIPYHFLFRAFLDGAFTLCVSTQILPLPARRAHRNPATSHSRVSR